MLGFTENLKQALKDCEDVISSEHAVVKTLIDVYASDQTPVVLKVDQTMTRIAQYLFIEFVR